MLPGETNQLPSNGAILSYTGSGLANALDFMTVNTADLLTAVSSLDELIEKTLEVSKGEGRNRFWQIVEAVDQGDGTTLLTLRNPVFRRGMGLPNERVICHQQSVD